MKLPSYTKRHSNAAQVETASAAPVTITSTPKAATVAKLDTKGAIGKIANQLMQTFSLTPVTSTVPENLYMMFPKPLALIDEEKIIPTVATFTRNFIKNEESTLYVVKRPIEGQTDNRGDFTFVTYTDKEPAVESRRVTGHRILPQTVIRDFGRYLAVEDPIIYYQLTRMEQNRTGAGAAVVDEIISPPERKAGHGKKAIILGENQFLAASLYVKSLPSQLPPNFLTDPKLNFDVFSVKVKYEPMRENMYNMLQTTAAYEANYGTKGKIEQAKLENLREGLDNDLTRLHKISPVYTVYGLTVREVNAKVKHLANTLAQHNVRTHRTPDIQEDLLYKRMPVSNYRLCSMVPTVSLHAFYPTPADILEPGGVKIGYNMVVGSGRTPVIINVRTTKGNQHMGVFGLPGGGKTFFVNKYLDEYWQLCFQLWLQTQNPDDLPFIVIVDPTPNSQYSKIAEIMGQMPYLDLQKGIGLDPIAHRFKQSNETGDFDEISTVADIITRLFELGKDDRNVLVRIVRAMKDSENRKTMADLPAATDEVLATMLRAHEVTRDQFSRIKNAVYAGMIKYGKMFAGEFPKDSFAVHIDGADRAARSAAMAVILMRVNELCASLPKERQKIIVIDEGYQALEDESASQALKELARGSRTLNTSLIFITQRPSDIASEEGIAIAKEFATLFIFPTNDTDAVAKMTDLQRKEVAVVKHGSTTLAQGRCVMIRGGHYLVQIDATPEQLRKYNTDPNRKV